MKRLVFALAVVAILAAVCADNDTTTDVSTATSPSVTSSSSSAGQPTSTVTVPTTSNDQTSAKMGTTAGPTAAPTTTAPKESTTAPPSPKPATFATLNEYSVVKNNVTCLLVNMTVAFVNKSTNVPINVTDVAAVDQDQSSCGMLTVTFGNNSFSLVFKNNTNSYHLDEIVAVINKEKSNATGLKLGQTSLMASYVCVSGFNVTLSNNLIFVGTNIQYQAFGVKNETFATAQVCVADIGNNVIIPIAVGCAVAGLIILVVVAYMIGRRRMQHRYEAM